MSSPQVVRSFEVPLDQNGGRLDKVLAHALGPDLASRRQCRTWIEQGFVTINGRVMRRLSFELRTGDRIEVHAPELGAKVDAPGFELTSTQILYEDELILVVNKPAGLPSQGTRDPQRPHLFGAVQNYVARTRSRDAYAGLHHRLDRDTSGVILFTVDRSANAFIAEQIREHRIEKRYRAVCAVRASLTPGSSRVDGRLAEARPAPPLPEQWQVRNHLKKAPQLGLKNVTRMVAAMSGGDLAITDFSRLAANTHGAFLEARPLTGRMHQIRAHLAECGWPIAGDATYGGRRSADFPRVMLHAASLQIRHPEGNRKMHFEAPLPEDIRRALAALRLEEQT